MDKLVNAARKGAYLRQPGVAALFGASNHLAKAGFFRSGRKFALAVVALPQPHAVCAKLNGLFHKKAASYGLAVSQCHHGLRKRGRGEGFRNPLKLHVFFADLAHHKNSRAAPAVQQAYFCAGLSPQYLTKVAGFLPFKTGRIAPAFRGQIKKRYAHDPTFSLLLLRALRTALNPSCNETRRL